MLLNYSTSEEGNAMNHPVHVNSCRISGLIFLDQLPLLVMPEERNDTGGTVYTGDFLFGKMTPPLWPVTSYRSAGN